jgi:formamidopyrimidine-DNA glycosylase
VPELPEVETIRRQLAPEVSGRTLGEAWAFPSPKFAAARAASGATIRGVGRRGKYLLIDLDDDRELIVHLGMTGALRVLPEPDVPADPYLRARWALDDGRALLFRDIRRFGRLAVVPAGRYESLPTLHLLGPEPFDDAFTPLSLWAALRASRARVKTQLLSQRPVAGVGNIYADEALWQAAIFPGARAISRPGAARLHAALREVLGSALSRRGTTLRDYRAVDGEPGDNQHHLLCYGRAGLACLRCGGTLVSRFWDGRTSTFCPTCQRR